MNLTEALLLLGQAVEVVEAAAMDDAYTAALSGQEVADLYVRCEGAREAVGDVQTVLRARLGPLLSGEPLTVHGVLLERNWKVDRKAWDHPRIKALVAERIVASHITEDGVVDAPVSQMIVEALNVPSISSWKSGDVKKPTTNPGLKVLGMDPNNYCESESKGWEVKVTWADGGATRTQIPRTAPDEPSLVEMLEASVAQARESRDAGPA